MRGRTRKLRPVTLARFIAPLLVIALGPSLFPVNSSAQTGIITGAVVDEKGQPVGRGDVVVLGAQRGCPLDSLGAFTITGVKTGLYIVRVSAFPFAKVERSDVRVSPGQCTNLGAIRMVPRHTKWPEVIIDGIDGAPPGSPGYHKPPKAIVDVLNARPFPSVWLSPARDYLLLGERVSYPPLSDLAAPKLRLAGVRVDPETNGQHRAPYWIGFTLKRIADGTERKIVVPPDAHLGVPQWTADGKRLAFTNTVYQENESGIDLWFLDVATANATRVDGLVLNAMAGAGFAWMPDQRTLLVRTIQADRGHPPPDPKVPPAPNVQEASGKRGIGSTYERRDVLETEHDEQLFDYYFRSTPVLVDTDTWSIKPLVGADLLGANLYGAISPSPDGEHLLVERIHRPYDHLHPYWRFPREVEIWSKTGEFERRLASLPLEDQVPIEGEPTGPRYYHWRPSSPATIVYVEALDGGDPRAKVPQRDKILSWSAPFSGEATEVFRLKERFDGIWWSDSAGIALVNENDRDRRWERTFLVDFDAARPELRLVWDMSENERYKDPGAPVMKQLPNGFQVLDRDGEWIHLSGAGATPGGDRPFLDRFDLRTFQTERLFRSERTAYETFAGWLAGPKRAFLTKRETPKSPPNFYVRTLGSRPMAHAQEGEALWTSSLRNVTTFPDPTPQLRRITKRIVKYKRSDGTPLSFTLYLPPGYKKGTRLPTVLWAYPLEYSDPGTAGQIVGSEQRFTTINGASELFFLLAGYAVLENVAMPAIGHPDSVYNTYLDQLVSNARAAIDKAVELGVTDRNRVGVGGHSHGAFMTANLLANCDLFRAGIARSGAYNQTIRPFGFQTERRTFFEAPESYIRLSPALHADKINEPLLLIHGEDDVNPGTVPLQSDLLYRAIVGTGGTARLVTLPLESHGYEARESIEETLYEMISWFDRYVKPARAREAVPSLGARSAN